MAKQKDGITSYEAKDCDLSIIKKRKVALMGFGAQGKAQALNMQDSGVELKVVLRKGSPSIDEARACSLDVISFEDCAEWADVFFFLIPDEVQPQVYEKYIAPKLKPNDALVFAHGLNIHWKNIVAPADVDVILVAPKGPGTQVRTYFEAGGGLSNIVAVEQDASGHAHELMLSIAASLGATRASIIESTFEEEAVTDLFGEQVVLCGGVLEMMKAGFEVLAESGVAPELAYNECIQEMKLIVDLVAEHGFEHTYDVISTTAEYGGYRTGRRLVTDETKQEMRAVLGEITSGEFAHEWIADAREGGERYKALKHDFAESVQRVDEAGAKARAYFKPRFPKKG